MELSAAHYKKSTFMKSLQEKPCLAVLGFLSVNGLNLFRKASTKSAQINFTSWEQKKKMFSADIPLNTVNGPDLLSEDVHKLLRHIYLRCQYCWKCETVMWIQTYLYHIYQVIAWKTPKYSKAGETKHYLNCLFLKKIYLKLCAVSFWICLDS